MKRLIVCLEALLFGLFFSSQLVAEIQTLRFSLTDLGVLSGNDAYALNDFGEVVGARTFTDGYRAFWYSDGTMTNLGVLRDGHNYSIAADINDAGQIVGRSAIAGDSRSLRPFLYSGGMMTELGSFGGDYGWAGGINNAGEVVGLSSYANGTTHAFLYSEGRMTDLWAQVSAYYSDAYSINDDRQIVGSYAKSPGTGHAYLWESGNITDLGDLSGGFGRSQAYKINNIGQVVGESSVSSSPMGHAFLWENGIMTDLGVLSGMNSSLAEGINDSGVVVGTSYIPGEIHRLFVWDKTNGMRDANTLLDSSGTGWVLYGSRDINDLGQIIGWGTNPEGEIRGFLLTPTQAIPEPSTLLIWLGLSGIGLLAAYRRRKQTM